jgi:8-oxo-dGTP pyrophosphatase MutT (NUDIX family)
MNRDPIPTYFFALVVVRKGHRFLLVHEKKHGGLWFLPGGRVLPGECLDEAARRETFEETGLRVVVEGVLRVQHSPLVDGSTRCRVLFVARPQDDSPPRPAPDGDSLGAAWVSLDELDNYPLRGVEVREIFRYAASGPPVYPLDLLASEGEPLLRR